MMLCYRRQSQQQPRFIFCHSQITEPRDADAVRPGTRMKSAPTVFSLLSEAMPSPVAEAMIESYALMVIVMGTFFLYFCGMVWAFCNPKLSNEDKASGTKKEIVQHLGDKRDCTQQTYRCASVQPHNAEGLTHSTYINFWDDGDGLLSDCSPFCREDGGIVNHIGSDTDWTVGDFLYIFSMLMYMNNCTAWHSFLNYCEVKDRWTSNLIVQIFTDKHAENAWLR